MLFLRHRRPRDVCAGCPANPLLISDQATVVDALFGAPVADRDRRPRRRSRSSSSGAGAALVRAYRQRVAPVARRRASPPRCSSVISLARRPHRRPGRRRRGRHRLPRHRRDGVGPVRVPRRPAALRLSRAAAVSDLVARLGEAGQRQDLRDALAEALGDPSLSLAYWVPEQERYVDAAGRPVELPSADPRSLHARSSTRAGRSAMICHDASLATSPSCVQTVAAAAALALENERLNAELRARVEELRGLAGADRRGRRRRAPPARARPPRRRPAAAGRPGAQPAPGAARSSTRTRRRPRQLLDEAADELERGDRRAARARARPAPGGAQRPRPRRRRSRRSPGARRCRSSSASRPGERLPAAVESAAYFVVAEALTNVARYARPRTPRSASSRRTAASRSRSRDDGVGGADPAAGSGLRGLADRVAALDGRLEVESPTGRGTTVRAVIPCG